MLQFQKKNIIEVQKDLDYLSKTQALVMIKRDKFSVNQTIY